MFNNMNTLLLLFIIVPILVIILLLLNKIFATKLDYTEKNSTYECGFSPLVGQTREKFQIHFYITAMLFLIFDLEILLILPISVSLYEVSVYGFSIAIIFFVILTIGFVLEIGTGVIQLFTIKTGLPLNIKSERREVKHEK
jgi:NADH:ubiquinone oxidoreductase subunit 3 (subunit A)